MLVERPFVRKYACAQQGSYHGQRQLLELQLAMEKLNNQSPIKNFRRYHVVEEDKVRMWQPVTRFNTHMASSCKSHSYINPSLGSEGPAFRKNKWSKRPVHRNFPKMNKEVSAFGPKHAENARRFYQAKRAQPIQEFRQIMVPPYRPNSGPMQVSGHRQTQVTEGVYLLGEPVFGRSLNQTAFYSDSLKSQVPVPDTSQPYETVLKTAKISPRPSEKLPTKIKTSFGTGGELFNHKIEQGSLKKSDNCEESGCEIDLSNAPVFQILCEISNIL